MTPEIAGYSLFYFMMLAFAYGLHVTIKTLFTRRIDEETPQ
jgi:hypothetical protein